VKTITVFETEIELLDAFNNVRHQDDTSPCLPRSVYLVVDERGLRLSGEGSQNFDLGAIEYDTLFDVMAARCSIPKVHRT